MTRYQYITKKLLEWLRASEQDDEPLLTEEPKVRTYIYSDAISTGRWLE